MTQDQDNIRRMFQTTVRFLNTNNSVWSGTPAFADAVTRAQTALDLLDTAADTQQTPTTGVTGDKASARDDLESKTLALANRISAYAAKTGNHDLGAQMEMTPSSLDRLNDNDLEQTAERVSSLATANIAALADYGVVAADATALNTARTTFAGIKDAPRQATAVRKAQTQSVAQAIRNARSIFRNEIDKMTTSYKTSDPNFHNGYFAARVIVNRGGAGPNPVEPPPPAPPPPSP